jgi:hypothetical protein
VSLLQHGQGFVLGCLHDGTLARPFVVDAHEVEYAVYDDAM